ncbi:MAG: aldehyde dehydrogenase family protein [Candidatus Omnitrophica bacterium]|nr:aldehyde dehydrogenase family protein [Candidatus Omnitrophota bacterium]MCF7894031.1 aldehyde dehydrogenase family protein [Candidatus Omnitrophota bacterium]
MQEYSSFINGEFKKGKEKKEIINPSNGEVITSVFLASPEDIDYAVKSARLAFEKGPWPEFSLAQRKDILIKLSKAILAKAKELAELESLNAGKPIKETTFMDIPSSAASFRYFASNLENFFQTEEININSQIAQAKGELIREPRGVVALISPWNYPLLIASWKLAQSLAAGNTVILKPSTLTPLTVLELAKIASKVGLPKGVLNVLVAKGEETGKVLCTHKNVDMISFTGSNPIGKKIIESSAKNIKKTIMELGGKSASLVLEDADIDSAVNGCLCSVFLNQGQMCTATSRIIIDEKIYRQFVEKLKERTEKIKLGAPLDFQTQIGPLISKAQRDKVVSFMNKAKQEGLNIISGGKIPEDKDLEGGFFFEPTLVEAVSPDSTLWQEEIFGPVATLTKAASTEEAISFANSSEFGLAASVWSKDKEKAARIAKKISAGAIWINTYGMFFDQLPFGGFKKSGFGKELGKAGFFEYTRLKNIITDQSKEAKPLVSYWYGF